MQYGTLCKKRVPVSTALEGMQLYRALDYLHWPPNISGLSLHAQVHPHHPSARCFSRMFVGLVLIPIQVSLRRHPRLNLVALGSPFCNRSSWTMSP